LRELNLSVEDEVSSGWETNPRPSAYKADALPSKLNRLNRYNENSKQSDNFLR
jgi:hypothetical protein